MKTLVTVLLSLLTGWAAAQSVPPLINYQGRLANADGTPFTTADYELRVSLYDTATGTNLVWGPQVFDGGAVVGHGPRIPVVQGYFNVMLGPRDVGGRSILEAFASSDRFVEISVSNRPPIVPRQQILPTPFAMHAADGTPAGSVIAFAGDPSRVPEGWLLCDGRALYATNYPQLYNAIRTNWGAGFRLTGFPVSLLRKVADFNLPDLRGVFLRGVSGSGNQVFGYLADEEVDPDSGGRLASAPGGAAGNRVGTIQFGAFRVHNHLGSRFASETHQHWTPVGVDANYFFGGYAYGTRVVTSANVGLINIQANNIASNPMRETASTGPTETAPITPDGGSETRPVNAYVNYIIKY